MQHIYKNTDELLTALAGFFIASARKAISDNGTFSVALSGGSSPKKLYEKLASADYRDQVDWSKVYFFFGDERYVPADDPDNNALMAQKALFEPLNIPEAQVYRVNTSLSPQEAAAAYARSIKEHFTTEPARFDLVLLGLGDDAHTASLFPGTTVLQEQEATAKSVYLKDKDVYRITLTAPLINLARDIAFLVYGATKAAAVQQVLEADKNTATYPAQLIQPLYGNVHWFLDEAAAALLINK
ncbi:6-phosphogluconolactonase [Pontibacter sp. 172403-2]|uniref:6-phosphogluconolactonase n=1 Tax=Pontibacter rufus TaxID=2791028 RepID=UPI0018AF80BC|nr:6-phosphogluconolactonase [Pontibacter sp. 172403-2]MBF9254891.1 6-phosphogluconolactonase [Pontibacter sp. 172403-2]